MSKQLEFKKIKGWGGRRRGAGRPNRSGQVSHGKRSRVDFKKPIHITLRLKRGVANLRTRKTLHLFRHAIEKAKKFDLGVVHYSLLSNHVHLIVEARNNHGLERGMKSLCGRMGKVIRRLSGGRGSVWAGRFHMHVLKTPSEMKRALEYVLLNRAKHSRLVEHADEYSSAVAFQGWRALLGRRWKGLIADQMSRSGSLLGLSPARSWLSTVGWKLAPD